MISSFIDGRVRIRAEALKKPETMTMARNLVGTGPGVLFSLLTGAHAYARLRSAP
jgi:hypothetical protein